MLLCAVTLVQKRYSDPGSVDKVARLRDEVERVRDAAVHGMGASITTVLYMRLSCVSCLLL